MNVGDLVELSAKGNKLQYCRHARNKIGIVVEIRSKKKFMYPIRVNWFGGKVAAGHLRQSLKMVSKG